MLDGKELDGVKHLVLDVPSCKQSPTLTLEIDVKDFKVRDAH